MKDKQILLEMFKIYGKPQKCWMGYDITAKNYLSFHHILERKNGGKDEINNGALLSRKSHEMLHKIELIDNDLYQEYNYWFKIINERKKELSPELIAIMATLKKRSRTLLNEYKEQKYKK